MTLIAHGARSTLPPQFSRYTHGTIVLYEYYSTTLAFLSTLCTRTIIVHRTYSTCKHLRHAGVRIVVQFQKKKRLSPFPLTIFSEFHRKQNNNNNPFSQETSTSRCSMIKVIYFVALFRLFLAVGASDDGIGSDPSTAFDEDFFDDLLGATGGKIDYNQAPLLEAMFGVNTEGADLGSRCGRRNPCLTGLECVAIGGVAWKICLPLACIQSVVDEYNEQEGEVTLFDNFVRNVMTGANLSPDSIDEAELVNETTLALGKEALRGENRQHILKDSVREGLIKSLHEEQAKDPLNIGELQRQVATCFQPILPQVVGGGQPVDDTTNNPGARRLTGNQTVATLPGYFLELAAVFQFIFALGVLGGDSEAEESGDVIVNDYCFGLGPTLGTIAPLILR
jgi:hypothetical protein